MNEQQPHISLGAAVAVMLAGAVAAVALFVALPSYGQSVSDTNVCVIDSYGRPIGVFCEVTPNGLQSRKERPATKGDFDALNERLSCLISQLQALIAHDASAPYGCHQ